MCRGVDRLDATTLIDGHIDDHRTWLHGFQIFPPNETWSNGTRNEDRSYHQIGGGDLLQDVMTIGVDECDVGGHHVRQVTQTLQTEIEDGDLGTEARRHFCRIDPDDAAAQDHYLSWSDSGNTAEEHPTTAVDLLEVLGALLHCHPAGYLRHRRQ